MGDAGPDRTVTITRRQMAGGLGCSVDTIDRALYQLVVAGALAIHRQYAEDGGLLPSVYELLIAEPTL